MLGKKIGEFNPGDDIQGFYLIKDSNLRTTANNKSYLDMTLMDQSGEINAKLWDATLATSQEFICGNLVKVRGLVSLWQNRNQLKITKIRGINSEDSVNVEDYVPCAPLDPEDMFSEIMGFVDQIENQDIAKLVTIILDENREKLMYYPAAKSNHHAIRSGLLYHILRMLKTGKAVASIYDELNTDLIYAGVILHDFAKIEEMNANTLGIVSEYSRDGQLLGHLIQGIRTIDRVARENNIDDEIISVIEHMILSHHYEADYGSPKKPLFPEAEILHYLDMIDARMYDMSLVLGGMDKGAFSEPVWVLDRRRLYKTSFDRD